MDKQALLQKFVAFTTAVHRTTHDFTKGIQLDDVTPIQYKMLEYIAVSQPVTLSSISDCVHMSMPNTSRELKKLSDKQLCEKTAAADDRRKQMIRLSEKGQALMDGAFGQMIAEVDQRVGDLSEEQLKEIEHALDLLQRHIFY